MIYASYPSEKGQNFCTYEIVISIGLLNYTEMCYLKNFHFFKSLKTILENHLLWNLCVQLILSVHLILKLNILSYFLN